MSIIFLIALICAITKGKVHIFSNEDYMLWGLFSVADALWVRGIIEWMR